VLETMPAKREVFAKLDQLTKPTCVLATNTSSLRVSEIAQATLHPERVVGLHFFNPVNRMPLVEIVRGQQSDDVSLATAVTLASRIGKTPVLTADASGFLVNRVLIPYLAEALNVASEGAAIPNIDRAMKQWGMPMGPFELLDEIGLDIGAHVLKSLGPNWPQPKSVADAIGLATQKKWLGKKTGIGFYKHSQQKRGKKPIPPVLNEELSKVLAPRPVEMDAETIQWRLVLPMVNEAAALLDERVVDSTETIDLAMVMGTGLAPFRGGIIHFAEDHGLDKIFNHLEGLATTHGPRFEPAKLLREAAANHRTLQEQSSLSHQQEKSSHAYVQTR
jgi:3-hydroxyacyl-CoA dehydrogenase/enoyl-CoA hydratase/3-hydroxybutyryl-CoA epimerase